MAGQSQAARMGNPLPIEDDQIRRLRQLPPGSGKHRQFPKGEQPRHIRESERDGGSFLGYGSE